MKNNLHLLNLFIICIAFNSCATWPTKAKYVAKCNSWLDSPVNQIIYSQGTPSNVYNIQNGNKLYSWLYIHGKLVNPTYYDEVTGKITSGYYQNWCKTTFSVNTKGIVFQWNGTGTACRIP